VAALGTLIEAKIDELNQSLDLIKNDERAKALALLNSFESRRLIGDIRDKITDILNAERPAR
jgi:hypothetical protein